MKKYSLENISYHPFELVFTGENPIYLVVGTFPTTNKRMSFNFFYPNSNNNFWKVMDRVFPKSKTKMNLDVSAKDDEKTKEKNKVDRMNFCKENRIAITDIIESCLRLDDNSKDEQLLVHHYNPIINILKRHPSIERVILTAKSSGASVHHHFYQYLTMNNFEFFFEKGEIPKGEISIDGRTINILSMPSTSSRNSHFKESDLVELYRYAFNQ
jgi:G:T/U-mismatch repair DNA glycosylase